jgi:hypothetical protein
VGNWPRIRRGRKVEMIETKRVISFNKQVFILKKQVFIPIKLKNNGVNLRQLFPQIWVGCLIVNWGISINNHPNVDFSEIKYHYEQFFLNGEYADPLNYFNKILKFLSKSPY